MSDAFYIALAYGLTALVVTGYTIYVFRRGRAAEARLVEARAADHGDDAGSVGVVGAEADRPWRSS